MIIRSQDKKGIVNLNNIDTLCIEQNHCGCDVVCFNGLRESRSKIGEYSTEEKAIKVLDMICDACRNVAFTDGVVFRMPADEDVEV